MSVLKNIMAEKFSQLPNELIEDTRISAKAFRVAAYLFSRPSGWEVKNADILNRLAIKDEGSLAKYWKELIDCGWLERERAKDENGKLMGNYNYTLNISAIKPVDGDLPYPEKTQIRGKSKYGKTPDHSNTNNNSNTEFINNNECGENATAAAKSEKKSIEQRAEDFKVKIRENKAEYPTAMLFAFFDYWTEKNENGKKMRFELQKVFDVKKRLATWHKRDSERKFDKKQTQPETQKEVYVRPKSKHEQAQGQFNQMFAAAAQKMSVQQ